MSRKCLTWETVILDIPSDRVNLALSSNGAVARASNSSKGFSPDGVINGNLTLLDWGKGNGWQAPSPSWHPNWWGEWVEVVFPEKKVLDTIIVYMYPSMVKGRYWKALKDFQVQYCNLDNEWIALKAIRNNVNDYCIVRFDEVEAASIRIWVNSTHYAEEKGFETGSPAGVDESPRILEIEAYRLGDAVIEKKKKCCLDIEFGEKGSIAVFKDDSFDPAPITHPDSIAEVFRAFGYGVTFLKAEELCEPELFNAANFDIFIHPYGRYIPVGTNIFDFLQGGGHLITFGGRAFTAAKQKVDGKWLDLGIDPGITVSAGRYTDYIRPYREQLGIFSVPHSELKRVEYIETSPGQQIVKEQFKLNEEVSGWMALGVTGELLPIDESAAYAAEGRMPEINHIVRAGIHYNKSDIPLLWGDALDENYGSVFAHPCARWIPVMNSYDAYGRDRGAVGALLAHYEGVYRGSHWAFFGVENRDLLESEKVRKALLDIVEYMQRNVLLHSLEPEYACYRQGEEVKFSAVVDNCSKEKKTVEIEFYIYQQGEKLPMFSTTRKLELGASGWEKIDMCWAPDSFNSDMYRIEARLIIDGQVEDCIENGFAVWDKKILEMGPKVEFKDNYFHFDGKPRYVIGTRDSGLHLPGQPDENALGWDDQYRMLRDFGMQVTSLVHLDWCIPGLGWGEWGDDSPFPEVIFRRLDAQAQLAQKYGLIFAPCIFFNYEIIAMGKPELARRICEAIGKRYKDVPGIMFYIFDDGLRHDPDIFNAWAKECVEGFNSCGREYMITAEMGFRVFYPDTLRLSAKNLTFTSGSNFRQGVGDPVYERLVDLRPAGKSFTLGEFVRRIPSGSSEDFYGYLVPPHVNFGMGYAMSLNWKWRTSYHTVWPSDVVFPGNWVPKEHLYAYRSEALFFRQFKPCYNSPELLVVMPSALWVRNSEPVTRYILPFLRRLIEMKVDFACVDDTDIELIPDGTKALIFPMALEVEDKVYEKLKDYVGKGGHILITGDLTKRQQDLPGEASRTGRLTELCGLLWKGQGFSPMSKGRSIYMDRYLPKVRASAEASLIDVEPYTAEKWINIGLERAEAVINDEEGNPLVTSAGYGKGKAWFTPDIDPELPRELLAAFLEESGVQRHRITPDIPTLHCFSIDTEDGPVYTLLTFPWDRAKRTVELTAHRGTVSLVLKDQSLGIVHINNKGGLNAIETQGLVEMNGEKVLDTDAHLMMKGLDGEDVRKSDAVVVFPITSGWLELCNQQIDFVEAGELADGRWRVLEKIKINRSSGNIVFNIDAIKATTVLLLYRSESRNEAVRLLEEALLG